MFSHSDVGASARNTEVDSSSVFAYAKYQPSNWYMDAVINYTMSDYSERGYALGAYIGSDYDIDAFGAYLSTGYNFLGGITPELSLRYMHLGSADYTSSLGINNHIDAADFLTASLGTKYEMDIVTRNGILFSPMMHYAINYDIVSDDNVVTIAIPGVNTYVLNGERLSRIGATVGVGLGMTYAGLDITLSYDLEARNEYTSQTGRVKFRYNF